MKRFIALVIILIPIGAAALGIKLMRDTIFLRLNFGITSYSLQFILGLIVFGVGLYVIGSFLLHRDRKRDKVQAKFKRQP